MTTETCIVPALTAAAWRAKAITSRGISLHADGLHAPPWTNDSAVPVLDNTERHGLAALALHDHPAGFTRGDIEDLQYANSLAEFEGGLDSLISRIEALLPPESV